MEPKNYVHKATEVEAIQLNNDSDLDAVQAFIGAGNIIEANGAAYTLTTTGEGVREVNASDYIIKGVLGKIYPCSAEVFEQSYDVKAE